MKLAWITDLHLGMVQQSALEEFCESITAAAPEAILLGGDIAAARDVVDWLHFLAERFQCPLSFVLGNHDYYGDRIAAVRARVAAAAVSSPWLCWLDAAGIVPLTADTGLIGHGGWADGRYGDYARAPMMLNDYMQITDFVGLDNDARARKLAALGDEAAAHIGTILPRALDRYAHVVLLTHVPPFREACWHENRISDEDALPHFACQAMGATLREIMASRPDRRLTVLCGHTHSAGQAWLLPNLHVQTGGAIYGNPVLQSVMQIA